MCIYVHTFQLFIQYKIIQTYIYVGIYFKYFKYIHACNTYLYTVSLHNNNTNQSE